MGGASLSKAFATLADPTSARGLALAPEQFKLEGRLEGLVRDVIREWLLRDLGAHPAPSADVLSERLSERGNRLRDHLIANAEGILFEGIVNSEQARLLRKATGRRADPLQPGRNGPPILGAAGEARSSAELAENLRQLSGRWRTIGPVSVALIGEPGMRAAYPNGIAHLDPVRQSLAHRDMPKVNLTREQVDLVDRLDKLIVDVYGAWLVRDLDKTPLPPRSVLAQRIWEGGERLRDSLFSRAEMIALHGIVSPEQADQVLTAVWEQYGTSALLDPTLASRLKLTRAQREDILLLLGSKKEISSQLAELVRPIWHLRMAQPESRLRPICWRARRAPARRKLTK